MDTARITQPAPQNTRELRALSLAEERFEEIALSHCGGLYTVPSLHGEHGYDVTYSHDSESCPCPDWQIRGATCYHVLAAAVVRARRVFAPGADVGSGIGSWSSA